MSWLQPPKEAAKSAIDPSQEFAKPKKAGEFYLVLLGARGLAAGDKRGTSDPYAKIKVHTSRAVLAAETTVQKKTLDPEWRQFFSFEGVVHGTCMVTIVVKDYDGRLKSGQPLGQVEFRLADQDLQGDGTWKTLLPMNLRNVTESGVKQVHEAKGTIEVMVAWCEPSEEEKDKMLKAKKGSAELKNVGDVESEESETEGSEESSDDDSVDGQPRKAAHSGRANRQVRDATR